jgi:2-oxoglutarate ferredoxin oxidoreductase subunit delta
MSTARNEQGVPYPELEPGCTGCGACLLVCPDFCFEVYRYETPVTHEVGA